MRLILTAMLAMVMVGAGAHAQTQDGELDRIRAGCALKAKAGKPCKDVGRFQHLNDRERRRKIDALDEQGFINDESEQIERILESVRRGMDRKYGSNWDPNELDGLTPKEVRKKFTSLYRGGHIDDDLTIIDDDGNERYFNSRKEQDEVRAKRDELYKNNRNYRILKDNGLEDYFTDAWKNKYASEVIRFAKAQRGDDFVDKRNKDASYRGQTWRERMAERYGLLDDYKRAPDAYEDIDEAKFIQHLKVNGRLDKKDPNDWDPKRVDDNTIWTYIDGELDEKYNRAHKECIIASGSQAGGRVGGTDGIPAAQKPCRRLMTYLAREGRANKTGYENRHKIDLMNSKELLDHVNELINDGHLDSKYFDEKFKEVYYWAFGIHN